MSDIKNGTIIGVDPSIKSMGVAVFKQKVLVRWECIHPKKELKKAEFQERALDVWKQLKAICEEYDPDVIVCETPDYWAVGGFLARESGAIFKLSFVCGMVYQLKYIYGCAIETPYPRTWKGQMPKKVVANRLYPKYKHIVDVRELEDDTMEAIGMCHWSIFGRV